MKGMYSTKMDDDIKRLTAEKIKQKTQYMKEQIAKAQAIKEYEKVKKEYERMKSNKEYESMYRSEYD